MNTEYPNELIKIKLDNAHVCLHRYTDNQSEMILTSLFVNSNNRYKGIGTKLMKRAECISKALYSTIISLQVEKDSWQMKWYNRLGYEFLEDSTDDLIWMRKYL